MITLFVAFFVLAPYIVLYTVGWRYDWHTNTLQGTGVISVDVKPIQAKTYINDILVGEKQPLRLASRAPGLYHLQIVAPGYRPWTQDITVASYQTTFIRNVQLYKQAEPAQIFENERDVLAAYPGTKNDYLLVLKAIPSGGYEISYLNGQNSITIATSSPNERPKITPAPDRLSALIVTHDHAGNRLLLANLNTPDTRLLGWQTSTPHWQWASNPSQGIILQKNDQLVAHNFTPASDQIITTNTSTVWFYDTNEQVWTATNETLFVNKKAVANLPEPITKILAANTERVLVQHKASITAVNLDNQGLGISQTTRILPNVRYSSELDEWLAWSAWELWDFYADGSVSLLLRSQEPIQDVYPLPTMGTIAIAYPTGIDAFNPGYFVTDRLANIDAVDHLEANERARTLYMIGRYRGGAPGLYKLDY